MDIMSTTASRVNLSTAKPYCGSLPALKYQVMGSKWTSSQKGFSLIELLIVVAIILIIAVIAIPNLLRARIAANEASAAGSVREISNAEIAYHTTYPQIGFAPDLISLGGALPCSPSAASACILDDTASTGIKSGYKLFAAGLAGAGSAVNEEFVGSAAPNAFNQSGVRNFCVVSDGVVRVNPGAPGLPPAATVSICLTTYVGMQ
jgi:prepilin-type N-terminal cleavage/methylation domain-containing protein